MSIRTINIVSAKSTKFTKVNQQNTYAQFIGLTTILLIIEKTMTERENLTKKTNRSQNVWSKKK